MLQFDSTLQHLVTALNLRTTLSQGDREAILALPYMLRVLDSATYIVREGDEPDQCGVIVSGFAIRQKVSGDGGRQILAIHLPGDAVDFQNLYLQVSDHSVQMLTQGSVAFVQRTDFHKLIRDRPGIGHAILVEILVEAAILREWMLNNGQRKGPERIAHLLCELGFRLDAIGLAEEYGYQLPMTQEELGDATGLTSVHVNRILRSLEQRGMISRQRRLVSFPNWQRLRELADFSERYLHRQKGAEIGNRLG